MDHLGALQPSGMSAGLLLTASRGAWLAVCLALLWVGVWQLARQLKRAWQRLGAFAGMLAGGLLGGAWLAMRVGLWTTLVRYPDVANRLWIFLRGLLLVRDYPFTGSGLGSFALVDSTYAQLIHVPTLPYSHALWLDAAVEQGIVGALALASLWLIALAWAVGAGPRR